MQLTVCVNCGKANQQLKAIATSNSRPLPSASPHNQQLKIIAKHIVMQPATQDHCHKQCKTNLHCKTNVRYATLRPAWQLKTIASILVKIKVHTEVINSRTNHIEGRSMIQFAAQCHNVSPQVAYRFWQTSSLQAPPCPTSQTFWQEEGCPLVPMDQAQANQYLTASMQSVLRAQTIYLQAYEAR